VSAPAAPRAPRELTSESLFAGGREVLIVHRGERYRLLLTRQGKLILNK
jgi:hemin uptake protein HemP